MQKQLFNLRVRQEKHTSFTLDFKKILDKYDMTVFLENYLLDALVSDKSLWRKIVNQSIDIYEENRWKLRVTNRTELCRYAHIHTF